MRINMGVLAVALALFSSAACGTGKLGPATAGNKEATAPTAGSTAATSGSQDTNGGVKAGPNKEVPDTTQKTGQGREPDQTHPK